MATSFDLYFFYFTYTLWLNAAILQTITGVQSNTLPLKSTGSHLQLNVNSIWFKTWSQVSFESVNTPRALHQTLLQTALHIFQFSAENAQIRAWTTDIVWRVKKEEMQKDGFADGFWRKATSKPL